jgi:hypothetical protein
MTVHNPLTCEIVERELDVPTGSVEPASIAAHLAACDPCAARAEAAARLDAAWHATRPNVPNADTWAALWSHVESEAPAHALSLRSQAAASSSRHRRWAAVWAVAAVAQVAALAVAYLILTRPSATSPPVTIAQAPPAAVATPALAPASAPATAPVAQVVYELEPGSTLFLVLDEHADQVVVRPRFVNTAELVAFDGDTPDPVASASQIDMELLNALEGLE